MEVRIDIRPHKEWKHGYFYKVFINGQGLIGGETHLLPSKKENLKTALHRIADTLADHYMDDDKDKAKR